MENRQQKWHNSHLLEIKMKTTATTTLLFLLTLVAHADLKEVGDKLGPQLFREGDSITIKAVKASSSKFQVGDTVTVKGSYTLESHEKGKLSLFVTQTEGDGRSQILPEQQFEVSQGKGDFEVSLHIRHTGYLHLTFYPADGGSGFGGVYFGQSDQMKEIEDWTLDWYLGGSATAGHTDRVSQTE